MKNHKLISFAAGITNLALGIIPGTYIRYQAKKNVDSKITKFFIGVFVTLIESIYIQAGVECLSEAFTSDSEKEFE